MAKYQQKIADALERVKAAARSEDADIVHSDDMRRQDRELLVASGWLLPIFRGWYLLVRADVSPGDSTPWYAHYWHFVRILLNHQYGKAYCLSAESSLLLHTGSTTIPEQLIVILTRGGGKLQQLPHNTSIYTYSDPKGIPREAEEIDGIRCMPLVVALCRVSPHFYRNSPHEAAIALELISSPYQVVEMALQYGLERGIGRVIGALEALGKPLAGQVREMLRAKGLPVREENPFTIEMNPLPSIPRSPYAKRVGVLWESLRSGIVDLFPASPEVTRDPDAFFRNVDSLYTQDAYHSLSIEGYRISTGLVERVRNQEWNPDEHPEDAASQDALAARGYYEAFQAVKTSIDAILSGANAADQFEKDLSTWYQALWNPSVQAGLIEAHHLAGYRRGPVYIRGSRHVPPPSEAILDSMEALCQCLREEEHAGVRAVLGHYIFVLIHPFPDGNGRIARFLLNTMLASGGYPWTVIPVNRRDEYIDALENTTLKGDVTPFAQFVLEEMP